MYIVQCGKLVILIFKGRFGRSGSEERWSIYLYDYLFHRQKPCSAVSYWAESTLDEVPSPSTCLLHQYIPDVRGDTAEEERLYVSKNPASKATSESSPWKMTVAGPGLKHSPLCILDHHEKEYLSRAYRVEIGGRLITIVSLNWVYWIHGSPRCFWTSVPAISIYWLCLLVLVGIWAQQHLRGHKFPRSALKDQNENNCPGCSSFLFHRISLGHWGLIDLSLRVNQLRTCNYQKGCPG